MDNSLVLIAFRFQFRQYTMLLKRGTGIRIKYEMIFGIKIFRESRVFYIEENG